MNKCSYFIIISMHTFFFYVHKLKPFHLCVVHISVDIIISKQLVLLGRSPPECTVDLSVLSQASGESV